MKEHIMGIAIETTIRLVSELKADCNRYVNGNCQALVCLIRGGHERGNKPDYGKATCERHEQVNALETILADSSTEPEVDTANFR